MSFKWLVSLAGFLCLHVIGYAQQLDKVMSHSHNDYEQQSPFQSAFDLGFSSIEADIYLQNGILLVGHDLKDLKASRTLANLYLAPLEKQQNLLKGRRLQLMIDVKSEALSTLDALIALLANYPKLVQNKQIVITISGNLPPIDKYPVYPRYIFFDGRPVTLDKADLNKIAMVSDSYASYADIRRSVLDTMRIRKAIAAAHAVGKPFRVWGNPDDRKGWKFLMDLGVDYINTDKIDELTDFLKDPRLTLEKDTLPSSMLHQGVSMMPYNRLVRSAGKVVRFGDPNLENHALDIVAIPGTRLFAVEDRYGVLVMDLDGKIIDRYKFSSDNGEWKNAVSTYSGIKAFTEGNKTWICWSASFGQTGFLMIAEWDGRISNTKGLAIRASDKARLALPNEIAIDPSSAGNHAYVVLNGSDELVKLSWTDKRELWRAKTGVAPFGICMAKGKVYVTNWAGPQVTDTTKVTAGVPWGLAYTDSLTGATALGTVSVYDGATGKKITEINTGLHPNEISASKDEKYVYVSNGNSDEITVIQTRTDQVVERIPVGMYQRTFGKSGSSPNGLSLSADNSKLYVSNGMDNAVAVIRLGKTSSSVGKGQTKIEGFIPTEAYPSGSAIVNDTLIVANLESEGANVITASKNARGIHYQLGSVSIIPLPNEKKLLDYTSIVYESAMEARINASFAAPRANIPSVPVPERIGEPSVFKHVVYIIKENKTYDQVFGDMKQGRGDSSLCVFGERITPNIHALARQFGWMDNYYASGKSSAEGHQWSNAAIVSDYVEKNVRAWFRSYPHRQTDAMVYNTTGYIWNNAVAHGKRVRIYGEACTTEYDRKLKWLDLYRKYQAGLEPKWFNTTTIDNLRPLISPLFPDNDNMVFSDQQRADVFIKEWDQYLSGDSLPNLMILSLPNDHTAGTSPGFPTPNAMVADNDLALGRILEHILKSKAFDSTVVFITQDDSQGGWDHISGYRTVGMVVSPYYTGSVVTTNYNQTSMVRTMEQILGIPPMNVIDATATPMFDCFSSVRKEVSFKAIASNVPLDEMNKPLSALRGIEKKYALQSVNEVYNEVDGGEDDEMNRIIWFYAKGRKKYPR
jgi:YVTN family beta-propeller protein